MLSEKQINFLEKYSEMLERLPSLKTLYDFATKGGIVHNEAIEIIFYYAESSKGYMLEAIQEFDPAKMGAVVTVKLKARIDPRDCLLVTKLYFKTGDLKAVGNDQIINNLYEILKVSYNIDLYKLKNLVLGMSNRW